MRLHQDTRVILGPPGTGKTTRLMREVEVAIESGIPPETIGYLAFTRKASRESVARAAKKFGLDRSELPNFKTLHALAYRELGLTTTDMVSDTHLREFGDLVGLACGASLDENEDRIYYSSRKADALLRLEQESRIRRVSPMELRNTLEIDVLVDELLLVSEAYRSYKRVRGVLDYTDLLERLLEEEPPAFDLLLIDEGQDLSPLQWEVVRHLASVAGRVVVAGDDDQAIYKWAGASVSEFLALEGQYEVLGQSYRVPRSVQRVAQSIIERVSERHEKEWAPREEDGEVRWATSDQEADLSKGEWLILARNHYVLRDLQDSLYATGIPFDRAGHSPIPASLSDAVSTWTTLSEGGETTYSDAINLYSYMRAGTSVSRGAKAALGRLADTEGTLTMEDLRSSHGLLAQGPWAEALDRVAPADRTFLERSVVRGESTGAPRVKISTIHGAKGGEADNVLLYTDISHKTYQHNLREPDDEARVFYVAATRARHSLNVVQARSHLSYPI